MQNRHSSRASRTSGFIPLGGGGTSQNEMDNGIPLTAVRSNASTGARKPVIGNSTSFESSQTANEKGEAHQRHAGRRRKQGNLGRSGTGDTEDVRLNAMGRLYAKIVGFSVITRYMVYVVPVGILLAVPLVVIALMDKKSDIPLGAITKKNAKGRRRDDRGTSLFLWIEITWLTLWAAKIVAFFIPKIFMFFCGIVSRGVRKYATILSNLTITLSLLLWALATWITFMKLFEKSFDADIQWVVILQRIFGALFVSSALLLAEKAIVQLISVSYHQRSFANRIKASKREIHLLGLLYDASRTLFPMYCREFADEDYVINDSIEMMLRKKAGRKKNGAATPMKLIGDAARFGDKVTSAFGNIAHEITGKQVFNPNSAHSIVLEALEKRVPSEALARRIWMSFVLEGKDALYLEDFQEVLGPAYKDEAEEAFNAIDSDINGDISLDEMRKAIGEGMKDIGQALRVFDSVLLLSSSFWSFSSSSSFVTTIISAGTTFLSLSFVFAVTAQEFLGSCIFLFVKHPFDVGDRVEITSTQMMVDRISLLYTVFTRLDTMQTVQIPNIQLNNLWIDNISRSKAMSETVELNVSYDTSFEDIELLRTEMEKFVRAPENSRDFQPDFSISVGGVGNLDKMLLYISIKHKSNWHNDKVRGTRRSKFMCALAIALKKVPIYGPGGGAEALGGPTNPTYSVAVTDQFASAAREAASKEKEAGRMVPTHVGQTEAEARETEQHAVTELNNRPLMVETQGLWDPSERDDRSPSGHDASEDPRRSRDIESVRTELLNRASTRGRRRAGEGLQNLTPTDSHAVSHHHATSPRLETFDEEARTGMPSTFYDLNRGQSGAAAPMEEDEQGLHPTGSQHMPHRGPSYRGPSPSHGQR
ncbi:hypothetical protein ACCO45_005108 [Purpureocillium lilacinum]|uniref:Uncharacterized protein n=1 Tax=Purpureocillium lilacinum TaxID=33203 RepID=A0ACC4DUR2_PURLI